MSNITAKVVADSISLYTEKRITTFELEYPRFIHAEFMTHRMISKNAASSRAIPVSAMLDNIQLNPAMPSHWGKNQAGMQANEEHDEDVVIYEADQPHQNLEADRESAWTYFMREACTNARHFSEAGYHKQIANRITEPFQMIKVVATATEWANFFWLRAHKDAQPEIRELAEAMLQALTLSKPHMLGLNEWHMPYFEDGVWRHTSEVSLEDALKISSAMCAQVSYRKADDTLEKARMVYSRLVDSKPVHASPFEHQATPISDMDIFDREGITAHHKELGFMSGNFAEWIQHRQLINDHTRWDYLSLLRRSRDQRSVRR